MSKHNIQFLRDFQKELLSQDTDIQRAPRYWSIMDYKWEVTAEGHHERIVLYDIDDCSYEPIEDYIQAILSGESELDVSEEAIEELQDIKEVFPEDIEEWIEIHDDKEYYLIHQVEVPFIAPDTCFLTKQEAKDHLSSNRHHYSDKAHTYAMTAWRAPKMEKLLHILENEDWQHILDNLD